MNADTTRAELDKVTRSIIGAAQRVSSTLGSGFLEKVYENALVMELQNLGLDVKQQHAVNVIYRGRRVGEYFADLFVEDIVIVELKVVAALDEVHRAQCLNYLRATGLKVVLLINFARPRLEVRRIVSGF
jgi:GxxExxY protein